MKKRLDRFGLHKCLYQSFMSWIFPCLFKTKGNKKDTSIPYRKLGNTKLGRNTVWLLNSGENYLTSEKIPVWQNEKEKNWTDKTALIEDLGNQAEE